MTRDNDFVEVESLDDFDIKFALFDYKMIEPYEDTKYEIVVPVCADDPDFILKEVEHPHILFVRRVVNKKYPTDDPKKKRTFKVFSGKVGNFAIGRVLFRVVFEDDERNYRIF